MVLPKASFFIAALFTAAAALVSCRCPEKSGQDSGAAKSRERNEPCPFRAVVLGDRTGGADDALFEAALSAATRLGPDMIISVGDLIDGYQPDDEIESAAKEWDDVLGRIGRKLGRIPLVAAAGNHDIWSDESGKLFKKRLGHSADASLDIGPARLIVFDTSRFEKESDIPDERLDWLARELARAQDRAARIVVTHRPLFAIDPGGVPGSPLHDVLIAGRADLVISGHWHHAMADFRDEIRYQVIGTSGGEPNRPGHPETGNFQQIGLLSINERGARMSLIPTLGALAPDLYLYEDNQLEWKIVHEAVRAERFEIDPLRSSTSGSFSLVVKNVTSSPMKEKLSFDSETPGWLISPTSAAIDLEPEESTRIRFRYTRRPKAAIFPGPTVSLSFPFSGSSKYLLKKRIDPTSIRRIGRSRAAPKIDGLLDDAAWIAAADLGRLKATVDIGATPFKAEAKALICDGALYLGVEIEDDDMPDLSDVPESAELKVEVEGVDHLAAIVHPDTADPSYTLFEVGVSGKSLAGQATLFGPTPNDGGIEWEGSESAAVSTRPDGWSAELRIPLDKPIIAPEPSLKTNAKKIGFNLKLVRIRSGSSDSYEWQPPVEKGEPSFGAIALPH